MAVEGDGFKANTAGDDRLARGSSRGSPASLYPGRAFPKARERPMTTFDDRKDSFERKFAHDEELRFKATARRNKLLGLWAAEKLGKSGADADAYAKEVVAADFEEAGDGDVIRKLAGDFSAKGVTVSDAEIRAKMGELMAVAAAQVKAGQ